MSSKKKPARGNSRETRQNRAVARSHQLDEQTLIPLVEKASNEPLSAKTITQRKLINSLRHQQLTFAVGPAGTGKTYICGSVAADMLLDGHVDKIIITRPAVEAEEQLGFLPGEKEDKYAPYIAPFLDVLNERLGKTRVEYLIKHGRIEASPFAYMRGKTFKNAIVILDEAQNATPGQMKLFLTRIGENCRVVINGDESQVDIRGKSGLTDAIEKISYIPSVSVIRFQRQDCVRSGLAGEILQAYEQAGTV
ncbi:PhoH family protein [Chitinibacter tainanensis]|uniref:PhoH family protein n=1 Tax=Chitinibacter tainanensis TaxID=230667 RepID=UPI0003FC41C7|nr:PhoH family protein [Chitinibacter tainanensis]